MRHRCATGVIAGHLVQAVSFFTFLFTSSLSTRRLQCYIFDGSLETLARIIRKVRSGPLALSGTFFRQLVACHRKR